jgi:4-alpha-glucanotransferase
MGISPELSAIDPREQKINEPSNPTHYWRYRLHISSEDLINKYQDFDDKLRDLIQASGRKI